MQRTGSNYWLEKTLSELYASGKYEFYKTGLQKDIRASSS